MSLPSPVRRVLVAGGTHGNEWLGAWLVQKWQRDPRPLQRQGFETVALLANPRAFARGVRYLDQDLNRCFDDPRADPGAAWEVRRAREILDDFGPAGRTPVDVVLDLHTTTSNMGLSYILTNRDPFNLMMAAWVARHEPALRVYAWIDEALPLSALSTIVRQGATIEVGPTANNVVRGDLLLATERVVGHCLDFIEAFGRGDLAQRQPEPLEVFVHLRSYDYPRDASGAVMACVHPELQDSDYQRLEHGDPIFLSLEGETAVYEGEGPVFPVFVNEAAYYEKGIAFSVARRETIWI
ncbi:MAG TPA: aspartoacylase [Polyangiaceae bacterium]|nr:aspartoacylase [Polyangiaceae bacterium]